MELLLLVVIELNHLGEEGLGDGVDRGHLVGRDRNLDVLHLSDDRLELLVVDSWHRLYHLQVILIRFFLQNRLLHWSEMLLVRQIDVVEKRTLSWQEGAGNFERLRMPEFGLLMLQLGIPGGLFIHLEDESDLGGVTEVGDSQETHFRNERLSCQLHLILSLLQ